MLILLDKYLNTNSVVTFQDFDNDAKAYFCGGILKYSEMLTSINHLLCVEDQGRVSKLFFMPFWPSNQGTTTTAATTTAGTTATTTATATTQAATTAAAS